MWERSDESHGQASRCRRGARVGNAVSLDAVHSDQTAVTHAPLDMGAPPSRTRVNWLLDEPSASPLPLVGGGAANGLATASTAGSSPAIVSFIAARPCD